MGIFKWLKKATKVIGKMAVEAAEEDERSKYSPNPEWTFSVIFLQSILSMQQFYSIPAPQSTNKTALPPQPKQSAKAKYSVLTNGTAFLTALPKGAIHKILL